MAMKKPDALRILAGDLEKSFGKQAVGLGGLQRSLNAISSGSLALDYELGIGGWPLGHIFGIFGQRDIGKSTVLGFSAIRNAQAMGLNCAIIAVEPNFDPEWAAKHGIDVDNLLVGYPLNGEEAFEMLHMLIRSGCVDFIEFDSVGALVSEVESKEGGVARVGGQAQLITWGLKVAAPLAYRNNVGIMMLNQIRDDMKAMYGGAYKQPGGHALEHFESIIVQLKKGADRYTIKQAGQEVQVGQQLVAHILRNKMSEGSGRRAVFDFFSAETDEYPFGIDVVSDTINTAKRVGILKTRSDKSSWYDLPDGSSHNGYKAVSDHLRKEPLLMDLIREQVLRAMVADSPGMLEVTPELVEEMASVGS